MRRDILIPHARWIRTIRNTVRLSRSFQDVQAAMAEDITPHLRRVDAQAVTFARVCFALTVAVSAAAATLSLAAKREVTYEHG